MTTKPTPPQAKPAAQQQPAQTKPTAQVEAESEAPAAAPAAPAEPEEGAVHTSYGGGPDPSILKDATPEAVVDYFYAMTNPRFRALSIKDQGDKALLVDLITKYVAHLAKKK